MLRTTLNGFGVQISEPSRALKVRALAGDFALRKHSLVQAMLAVNDLFYLASPTVASLFHDDVMAWLDTYNIRYTPNVKFAGKSGTTIGSISSYRSLRSGRSACCARSIARAVRPHRR